MTVSGLSEQGRSPSTSTPVASSLGQEQPATVIAVRVSRASVGLGGFGLAAAVFVITRPLEAWRMPSHGDRRSDFGLGGQDRRPAASLDAIVIKAGQPGLATELKGARFTLWMNPERLTNRHHQKLARVQQINRDLYRAHLIAHQLRMIYRVPFDQVPAGDSLFLGAWTWGSGLAREWASRLGIKRGQIADRNHGLSRHLRVCCHSCG